MAQVAAIAILVVCLGRAAAADELGPRTVAAYEEHAASVARAFAAQSGGELWLNQLAPETVRRLLNGEVLAWPGAEDGILKVPGGLVHHWRGAAFIPNTTLKQVLAYAQDYRGYAAIYPWIVRSDVLAASPGPEAARERYWALLRIRRSASVVTSTVDVWSVIDYVYPSPEIAMGISDADCIREVENPGKRNERRLKAGTGHGYLWRANTYTTYLERDGGVYVDLQTLGLSRGFPPLLGWIVEPIARRLGRGSATESLAALRNAVREGRTLKDRPPVPSGPPPPGGCGSGN